MSHLYFVYKTNEFFPKDFQEFCWRTGKIFVILGVFRALEENFNF